MGNVYVAWLHNAAIVRMALMVLPRLSQDGDVKQVRLDFPSDGGCTVHATTPSFAGIRVRAVLAETRLTCASSARQVRPGVAQVPCGALPLGNGRER
jgi:hypothetical protein